MYISDLYNNYSQFLGAIIPPVVYRLAKEPDRSL